jgi:hypothetical protein
MSTLQELPQLVRRLQPPELAEYLDLTTYTLQRYRCEGTGPAYEKIGNRIYYRLDVVEEWLQSNGQTSTAS